MSPSQGCSRCGSPPPHAPAARCTPEAIDAAWRRCLQHTVVFVALGQLAQTLQRVLDGPSPWTTLRQASTLLLGMLVAWQLSRRSVWTLRLWSGVVVANLPVMAVVSVWALARARTEGRTLWMTVWAWVTVWAYLASLRRVRAVLVP